MSYVHFALFGANLVQVFVFIDAMGKINTHDIGP